jgi:hypothetical protein
MNKLITLFIFLLLATGKLFAQSPDKIISKDDITGSWAAEGGKTLTFIIEKNKIVYPEQNKSYKYSLDNNRIKIKYDGFDGDYLVVKQAADTIVFISNEKQYYYRFKK